MIQTLEVARRGLAIALLLAVSAAHAADPFYEERLEAGIRAARLGDFEQATFELEIACFGFLEEPPLLAQGLVRLAMAQAALGDRRAFRDSFDRLVEADTRFGAYAAAALDPELQASFEQQLVRWVPPATLRELPTFRRLAVDDDEPATAASPREHRRELQRRLEREGDRPELLTALATLELDQNRPARALDWLDRLPAAAAPAAACLFERAAESAGDCPRRPARGECTAPTTTADEFHLGCLVREDRWPEAAALLAELPPTARRRVARLEQRIANNVDLDLAPPAAAPGLAADGAPAAVAPAAASPPKAPPAEGAPAAGATTGAPTPSDSVELEALKTRLATASSLDEARSALAGAADLADRHPRWLAAQLVAAEAAYLASDWQRTIAYLRRAGDPARGQPRLAFYYAVALYETGDRQLAAEVLRPLVPRLERNDFVDSYVNRILGSG